MLTCSGVETCHIFLKTVLLFLLDLVRKSKRKRTSATMRGTVAWSTILSGEVCDHNASIINVLVVSEK